MFGQADRSATFAGDLARIVCAFQEALDLLARLLFGVVIADHHRLLHDLGQRPHRPALSVRETTSAQHQCLVLDPARELKAEAGLADPDAPKNGHEPTGACSDRLVEYPAQRGDLAVATNQGASMRRNAPTAPGSLRAGGVPSPSGRSL